MAVNGYERGDSIIWPGAVDRRIEELRRSCRLAGGDGLDEWEAEELAALYRFRRNAWYAMYQWEDHPGLISAGYFPQWAESEAQDLYGKEAVQSAYFDLDSFEDDRRAGMSEVDYDGTTYYG